MARMKKLIHVVRGLPDRGMAVNLMNADNTDILRVRHQVEVLNPRNVEISENFATEASFFLVNEKEVPMVLEALAHHNPGREVRVYGMEQVAQCPSAAMVLKKVSEHGVLPDLKEATTAAPEAAAVAAPLRQEEVARVAAGVMPRPAELRGGGWADEVDRDGAWLGAAAVVAGRGGLGL